MAVVDLVFDRAAWDGTRPIDMVFGAEGDGPLPGGDATATMSIVLRRPIAAFNGVFGSSPQYRGPRGEANGGWQTAKRSGNYAIARHGIATRRSRIPVLRWAQGTPLRPDRGVAWDESTSLQSDARVRWQIASAYTGPAGVAAWQIGDPRGASAAARWQQGTDRGGDGTATWQTGTERSARATSRHQVATPHAGGLRVFRFNIVGLRRRGEWVIPWGEGMWPRPGRSPLPYIEPPEVELCYDPPLPGEPVDLIFKQYLDTTKPVNLVFICDNHPSATVVVPIRRVYMVYNTLILFRVDGEVPIPATRMSMSMDVDSWTWSFSANVPATALGDLTPTGSGPVLIQATINGVGYQFLVEKIARAREYGKTPMLTISGRGKSCYLDAPYDIPSTYGNTETMLSQQLAELILSENGVRLDWGLSWYMDDWPVPGNVWTHQGTRMAGLVKIAQAAGGHIVPDPIADHLEFRLRYPFSPWEWSSMVTPDFELPDAAVTRESIEWRDLPQYNRVYVSGESAGILGQVTRDGTAGDLCAPMITDALITDINVARMRGQEVLSQVGRQAMVGLRLPVFASTGIIQPGKFVRYMEGGSPRLGIVRSTSVDMPMPDMWQSITLETFE